LNPEPILKQILREAWEHQQSGKKFLAAFDLDSTLFDLTLRISAIIDEFAAEPEHQTDFAEELLLLKRVKILSRDWGLDEPLRRVGLDPKSHFAKVLHQYWVERFFQSAYLIHDDPLKGAVQFAQELHQIGCHIMYLTGRDVPRMGTGTYDSLRQHHFPTEGELIHFRLKSDKSLDDALFKLDILKDARKDFARIWLFENEPVNLNLISRHCPEIGLVFIDSTHSGREQLQLQLATIKHFEVDLSEFRNQPLRGK